MTEPAPSPASVAEAARYLTAHPEATAIQLSEHGLAALSVLAPERILCGPVDADRLDLVDEFRRNPLGPWSEELRQLLWHLRAQTPVGRYVLERAGESSWHAVHLVGTRRPRGELVPGPAYETLQDAEWGLFRLRWRDQTGCVLPATRDLA